MEHSPIKSQPPRPSLVTTLLLPAGAGSTLDSFIRWHLHIGFEHIFLFFDDPDDPSLPLARAYAPSQVSAIVRSPELRAEQEKTCALWASLGKFYDAEVQARQSLNCEVALRRAEAMGLTWLLHIDVDELFFTQAASVVPHFAELEARGVEQLTYVNHEGVPERADVVDYYKHVTLFRKHHFQVPMSDEARRCMRWWEQRTNHGQYMLVYDNGKSAARIRPGLLPKNVHEFSFAACTDPAHRSAGKAASCRAFADARQLDLSRVYRCEDPCILHYVVCGAHWFRTKYEILGDFPSAWFGGALPIEPCFHLDARDVVQGKAAGEGPEAVAGQTTTASPSPVDAFFESQVLLSPSRPADAAVKKEHLRHGVLAQFRRVSQFLRRQAGDEVVQEEEEEAAVAVAVAAAVPTAALDALSIVAGRMQAAAKPPPPPSASASGSTTTTRPSSEGADAEAPPQSSSSGSSEKYSYNKAWLLSSVANEYLSDQFFGGGNGGDEKKKKGK